MNLLDQFTAERRRLAIEAAEALVGDGHNAKAINQYAKVLASFPNDETVLRRLADLYTDAGDDPSAIYILLRLALVYETIGNLAKAVAVHKRINRIDRLRISTYEELARLYGQMDLFYEAGEQWRELASYASRIGDREMAAKYEKKVLDLQADIPSRQRRRKQDNPLADLAVAGVPVVAAPVDMMIFLGHASEDKPAVRYLYRQLQQDRFQHGWMRKT